MCRWFAYIGDEDVLIEDLIIKPKRALVKQIDSHYLPSIHIEFAASDNGSPNPLSNLDGFGVVHYSNTASEFDVNSTSIQLPSAYHSIRPPLNDRNLISLAQNTATRALFSHIRAATGLTPVANINNHPFLFEYFEIKIKLLSLLSTEARKNILGTTDSEHIAALFFTHLDPTGPWRKSYEMKELEKALRKTIKDLQRLVDEVGGDEGGHSDFNFCIGNCEQLLATRFAHPPTREPPSLYYSTKAGSTLNRKFQDHPDGSDIIQPKENEKLKKPEEHGLHVIVASEPSSTYKKEDWHLIKAGQMISVDKLEDYKVVLSEV